MLKSCSLLPKIFPHYHDPTWSDENGEVVIMKQTFMGFLKKFHLAFLVNFLLVWERRFFFTFIHLQSLNFSACTFELTKLLQEKQGWFINQRLLWLSDFHEDKIQKKLLPTTAINKWTWKNYETVDSDILFPTSSLWIWLELNIAYWHGCLQFKCLFLL